VKYNRIIFLGSRCSGKSFASKLLAKHLGWKRIDMDIEIKNRVGKSIQDLTNNGKDWFSFRKYELELLKELLEMDNIVIGAGGGVGVNNIKYDDACTFGEIESKLLKNDKNLCRILLKANDNVIRQRLLKAIKKNRQRVPLLNADIEDNLSECSIQKMVDDDITVIHSREKDYNAMGDFVINVDSGITVEKIMQSVKL